MKMYAPDGVNSASVGSTALTFFDDRSVEVSHEDAQVLKSHGFTEQPPAKPMSEKELASVEKAKTKAQKAHETAVEKFKAAQAAVLDAEGRGDAKLLKDAQAAMAAAQAEMESAAKKL